MLIGLVSAKGAPGVTTAALTLAAVAPDDPLMIELDPSGGSIECWTDTSAEPGLLRVASALRRSVDITAIEIGIGQNPPNMQSILAPAQGALADSTIAAIGHRLGSALTATTRTAILDGGRWARSQPTANRLAGCDVIAIICQPTVGGIEAARGLAEQLEAEFRQPPSLLLIGDKPYRAADVVDATGLPVAGVLPWDGHAVNTLIATGPGRAWSRFPLARAARVVFEGLAATCTPTGTRA
jgi:hypothetical protein